MTRYPNESSCPIRERTGDGVSVGRCYFHCPEDVCPRHGNVAGPLTTYRQTGKLTDEYDFRPLQHERCACRGCAKCSDDTRCVTKPRGMWTVCTACGAGRQHEVPRRRTR